MKNKRLCLSILCVLAIFISTINVYATDAVIQNVSLTENNISTQNKIICKATLDDDFADDSVIIVINKEYSKRETVFTPSHFKSIEIAEIKSITSSISNLSTASATAEEAAWKANTLALTNVENFKQIIEIKLKNPGKENVLKAIKELEKIDYIESAEPNYYFYPTPVESNLDDLQIVSAQEEVNEITQPTANIPDDLNGQQYALNLIDAPRAWDITTGSQSVRVGIIDSGISNHPDLSANLVSGWDFFYDESDTTDDDDGHGTHVAGIIGAKGNNDRGICGVNWNVSLVPLQVVDYDRPPDENGNHPLDNGAICEAIQYARENNIPIINCSFGSLRNSWAFETEMSLYDGLIVCAAGNGDENGNPVDTDDRKHDPSCCPLNNIISVASTTMHDTLASDSNYGATTVDLAAPGFLIYSTLDDFYGNMSGTSMAAPHVTGVAALLKSKYPNLTTSQIKNIILNSVDEVSSLDGKCVTGGRLNAYNALRYADQYYTITYNANGGMGTMADTRAFCGEAVQLRELSYGRYDYVFDCWYIKRSNDNKWRYQSLDKSQSGWYTEGQQPSGWTKYRYEDGESIPSITNSSGAVITFYAQWTPTFTIVYEANGGSGIMENTDAVYGKLIQLRENTFMRTGYTFDCWNAYRESDGKWRYRGSDNSQLGWYTEGQQPAGWVKCRYEDGVTASIYTTVAGDAIRLYAQWKKHFVIRYNANGGFGTMLPTTVVYGQSTNIRENTFIYEGYEFIYWYVRRSSDSKWDYISADGEQTGWYTEGQQPSGWTKRPYYDGQAVSTLASNPGEIVTFYAQWSLAYRIQYNANGGEGTMPDTAGCIVDGNSGIIQLPECAFTKEGYLFSGWYVYDPAYDVWAYTDNGYFIEWYIEGEEPEGYYKHILEDQSEYNVANDEPVRRILYAIWFEQ